MEPLGEPAPRRSSRVPKAMPIYATPPRNKRKRDDDTDSESGADRVKAKAKIVLPPNPKKQAKDDALKIRIDMRGDRDTARAKWFAAHAHLFLPLLPANSPFAAKYLKGNPSKTFVPRRETIEQPALVTGEMKEYQLQGLAYLVWMYRNGLNCILGDEMGLGKTLQTLSLFAYIEELFKKKKAPHLIVCPLSVLSSWEAECARWTPTLRLARMHGSRSERDAFKHSFGANQSGSSPYDIVLTTYETYAAEDRWFKHHAWMYCVLDEGHRIKGQDTQIRAAMDGMSSIYRLILTGTPLQNNLTELWTLLHFLYPMVFTPTSATMFSNAFCMAQGTYNLPFLDATSALLAVVMLRRTKATLESSGQFNVPEREEYTVFLPLSEAQRFWTYRLLGGMDRVDMEKVFGAEGPVEGREGVLSAWQKKQGTEYKRLKNLLMQLRQVNNHPYCLDDVLPEPYTIGEHIVSSSVKLTAIDKLLKEVLPKGEKVLIFSQFTRMLDLLEDFMTLRGYRYARLDGSTCRPRRTLDIKLFQKDDSPFQVYLISTRAGGLGINLTKASTVVMCDTDWNPQNDLQAIARAHRIGQTKTVKVYRLICRATVEDQMLDRVRRKLFLSLKVMNSSASASPAPDGNNNASGKRGAGMGLREMMDILRDGSSALTSTDDGMSLKKFLEAGWDEVVKVSRRREGVKDAIMKRDIKREEGGADDSPMEESGADADSDESLDHDIEEEQRQLLVGVAQVKSRLFEGQLVAKSNKDIADEWRDMQKRARKGKLIMWHGMAFAPEPSAPVALTDSLTVTKKQKVQKPDKQWEEWCNYCRDGGELVMCNRCPRVFHASCHGVNLKKLPSGLAAHKALACSQHSCCGCGASTSDSGGMLLTCRTCPRAWCDSCMEEEGEPEYIGEILPEFALLDQEPKSTVFFVQCLDCKNRIAADPAEREDWEHQFARDERRLAALRAELLGTGPHQDNSATDREDELMLKPEPTTPNHSAQVKTEQGGGSLWRKPPVVLDLTSPARSPRKVKWETTGGTVQRVAQRPSPSENITDAKPVASVKTEVKVDSEGAVHRDRVLATSQLMATMQEE